METRTTTTPRLPGVASLLALAAIFGTTGCSPDAGEGAGAPVASGADAAWADAPGGAGAPGAQRLPDGFPADFPLPPGFALVEGRFTGGDDTTRANYLVRGTVASSVAEVAAFYSGRLPASGYRVDAYGPAVQPGATHALVYFHGKGFADASVQLSGAADATSVLISLPVDAAGGSAAAATTAGPASLPAGFPRALPLPPDLQVVAGHCAPPGTGPNAACTLRGTSATGVAELATFYAGALPRAGFLLQETPGITPGMTMARLSFEGDAFQDAYVRLFDDAGTSSITIHLPHRR